LGDCREILPGLAFDVIVTDPPYGIGWTGAPAFGIGGCSDAIAGDANTDVRDWVRATYTNIPTVMFGSDRVAPPSGAVATLVFAKPTVACGRIGVSIPWLRNWEPIFICGQWPKAVPSLSAIIETSEMAASGYSGYSTRAGHPHAKPVDVLYRLLAASPPGIVVDPFMGSGTTLRAAKDLGRKAIGIEISEKYCEIAAKRLAQQVLEFT
jgi:site-specific DNA-methyltransferase (adenine-specific)